jgi:hypothetical protein
MMPRCDSSPGEDFSEDLAMILFPAMLVGGHLLVAVADRVPELNFEPICRDGEAQKLGVKDDSATCVRDEKAARDQLAQKWDQFDSADRTRCVRMSTTERTASYVEVLTCLEMNHDARKLRQGEDAGIAAPEPAPGPARESPGPAVRNAKLAHPPEPLPLTPPEPRPATSPGFPQILCLPGLQNIITACQPPR